MRLDVHVVAVGADRERRADVDALAAAGLLRARMGADRRLVGDELRLLELSGDERELGRRLRLRERIGAGGEVPLRGLVLTEPRRRGEVENEIEVPVPGLVATIEIDRSDVAAGGHAGAMLAAAVEVDLERAPDRVLGARAHARPAARAEVEIDRVLLLPPGLERPEPARERGELPGKHRIAALSTQRRGRSAPQIGRASCRE